MAVLNVADIIKRVQKLLDDPAGIRFSAAYIMPYIDQENEAFEITLERLGIQQQERIAIFNIPVATSGPGGTTPPFDLWPYFQTGQPLQWLLRPKRLDWKIQGQPDTSYCQSDKVDELDDVQVGSQGALQYRWAAGSIQVTPSFVALTLRVYFFALATDIGDPSQLVMRGVGFILATQVAAFIAALNNNMGKLQAKLEKNLSRDKQNLSTLLVMESQAANIFPRGTKRGQAAQISAGGNPYV